MQIGKFTFGMRGHDLGENFAQVCENAKKNDITTLQFAPAKTMSDVNFDAVGYDEGVAERMASGLKEYDLSVSVLGCYINPIAAEGLEGQLRRFESFIPYAKATNATVIGTETGWSANLEEIHSAATYSRFIKSMERLLPVAEKYNVNIGIEPVWHSTIYSVEVMKQLLDYFKSENLCVILDPVNIINCENYVRQNEIMDMAVELLGDKIKSFHLKDYLYENGGIKRVPVGLGQIDIAYCLKKLCELNTIPNIMLDEMPLENLASVRERLEKVNL